jgi:23S rRNA pseudouridine2605 synthase
MKRLKGEGNSKAKAGREPLRLNKALADAGVCSRRDADKLIEDGRVSVNGETIREMGTKVDLVADVVAVDGLRVEVNDPGERVYLALNKPRGVVSSMKSQFGEQTLRDLVPPRFGRLFPVGRLDRDSQGLVLMTNDGELAHRLMHPSQGVERVYHVTLDEPLALTHLKMLRDGHVRMSDNSKAQPMLVEQMVKSKSGNPRYVMVLREGKKREIRELVEACHRRVKRLKRVAYGPLEIGDATVGRWRVITSMEIKALQTAAGLLDDTAIPTAGATPEPDWEAAPTRPARAAKSAAKSAKGKSEDGLPDVEVTFDDFVFKPKAPRKPRAPKGEAPARGGKPGAVARSSAKSNSFEDYDDRPFAPKAPRRASSRPAGRPGSDRAAGPRSNAGKPDGFRSAPGRDSGARSATGKPAAPRSGGAKPATPRPVSSRPPAGAGKQPAAASKAPVGGDGAETRKASPWGTPKSVMDPTSSQPKPQPKPGQAKPAPAKPAGSRPPAARPAGGKPATGRPVIGRPSVPRPAGSRPGTARPPSRPGAARGGSARPGSGAGSGGMGTRPRPGRAAEAGGSRRGANRPRGGKPTSPVAPKRGPKRGR